MDKSKISKLKVELQLELIEANKINALSQIEKEILHLLVTENFNLEVLKNEYN